MPFKVVGAYMHVGFLVAWMIACLGSLDGLLSGTAFLYCIPDVRGRKNGGCNRSRWVRFLLYIMPAYRGARGIWAEAWNKAYNHI